MNSSMVLSATMLAMLFSCSVVSALYLKDFQVPFAKGHIAKRIFSGQPPAWTSAYLNSYAALPLFQDWKSKEMMGGFGGGGGGGSGELGMQMSPEARRMRQLLNQLGRQMTGNPPKRGSPVDESEGSEFLG